MIDFEEFKKKCKGRKDVDFCFIKSSRGLPVGGTWDCKDCYELSKRISA